MRGWIDEELLKSMWPTHPIRLIALALGCSASHVCKRASLLGLPKKKGGGGVRVPDPTPIEVIEGASAMQSRWSRGRRKSRQAVKTPPVPVHSMKLRR